LNNKRYSILPAIVPLWLVFSVPRTMYQMVGNTDNKETIICLMKPITVCYSLVQSFPAEYFRQEIVVIPATAGTSFGKVYFT
jgi:hypothetical protein